MAFDKAMRHLVHFYFGGGITMINHQPGMVVRQKAIDWWPYIGTVINRINKAADDRSPETFDNIFLDAAKVVEKHRKVVTINELEEQLKPLREKLDIEIRWYVSRLRDVMNKQRRLENPINKNGKPLKELTLKSYRSVVVNWPKTRDALKKDIKALADKLKPVSNRSRTITRGHVSLRVIYGGQSPAKYEVSLESGWKTIR